MSRAFSIIELIFVIIIFGVVGTISSETIFKIYQNYYTSKETTKLQLKAKILNNQIFAYINRSIKDSIVRYKNGNYEEIKSVGDGDLKNGDILLWIDKDMESLRGFWQNKQKIIYPGYSKILKLNAKNPKSESYLKEMNTTDCNLSIINAVKNSILPSKSSFTLYFIDRDDVSKDAINAESNFWANDPELLFRVDKIISETKFKLLKKPDKIGEFYLFSYTAYGLKLDGSNLKLIWDFQPWENEKFNNGTEVLIAKDISKFQFFGENGLVRILICFDNNSTAIKKSDKIEICQESLIF